jgi:hypothetical protein
MPMLMNARILARVVSALLLVMGSVAIAAAESFRFEGGMLEIPPGFNGPVQQRQGDEILLYGFTKPHPGRSTGTLMQITVFRPPGGLRPIPQDQEAGAAEKYLLDILKGVEQRRSEFSRGPVEPIVVNGKAVAKVRWRGRAGAEAVRGVMYCYVDGPHVISFHTQDLDSAPPDAMAAAVRAFETVSFPPAPR